MIPVANPYSLDTELIADWLELYCLGQRENSIGYEKLKSIACEQIDLPSQRLDVALNLMKRRLEILGNLYPFEMKSVGMVRRNDWENLSYTYLLRISSGIENSFSLANTSERILNFENLVVKAMVNLLGPNGLAIRFGFPSEDRPVEFPRAVRWLGERMGVPIGNSYRPPRRKDGGVDVVAWRPFQDRRNGFPVYLVQVTCERNFSHKTSDIDLRVWSGWLNLDVEPYSVLAVPSTIPSGEDWNELSSRVIVLERLRIVELLGATGIPSNEVGTPSKNLTSASASGENGG